MNALLAILNIFIDPAETVRRIRGNKLAWAAPILLGGVLMGLHNLTIAPLTLQALRNDPPAGLDAAKLDQMVGTMQAMSRFTAISAPIMFALMTLIGAAIIFAMCVIFTVNVTFPDVYNLMAHVGLVNALQTLAHTIILRSKSGAITLPELTPQFGLDLFVSPDAPKLLHGLAGFFSVFTVWHIIVLGIGFAALARIGKGKAFVVTAPSWIVGLIFALIGSLFR